MFIYQHPSNCDNFNEWRIDGDWWFDALFERDAYSI